MAIYSGFSHWKWWLSIVMLVYQRVHIWWWNPHALLIKDSCFSIWSPLPPRCLPSSCGSFSLYLQVSGTKSYKITIQNIPKLRRPYMATKNNRQSFYKHPIKLKTGSRISIWFWVKITEAPRQKEIWVLNALIKLNNPPFLTPNSRATPNLSSGFCSVLRPCSHVAPRS